MLVGIVLAAAAAFLYARFGPSGAARVASGSLKGKNVLLVTLDTTRADHLPAYGYKSVKTPGLDRIASKSLIFEDAIAQAPLTLPSHASILTGQLPIWHGVRDNEGFFVDPKNATSLAAILKGQGYQTAAFVSAFVLDSRWGLDQGFDTYFDNFDQFREVNRDDVQRKAEETASEAERWLQANKDRPFFCWVHLYDPHEPYDPPEPFASTYAANRYDGEIAYMDQSIAKLMATVDALGLADRTLVVVTGDHGEGLGEHDEPTHAMFLYRTTLEVPLFIQVPGGRERRIPGIVRHIDLAPTILDLLGTPPGSDMQGASLIPLINGDEKTGREAYSESIYAKVHYGWAPQRSITTAKYEFIDTPKAELYDREEDPRQLRNLIETKAAVAESLKERLHAIVDRHTRKDLADPVKMDADTEAKLRSLGYLGTPVAATPESLQVDPKDKSSFVRDVNEAVRLLSRRDFDGALRLVLPVAAADPNIVDAHLIAGSAYANLERHEEALAALFKVIAAKPDHTMALATIGTRVRRHGEPARSGALVPQGLEEREGPSLHHDEARGTLRPDEPTGEGRGVPAPRDEPRESVLGDAASGRASVPAPRDARRDALSLGEVCRGRGGSQGGDRADAEAAGPPLQSRAGLRGDCGHPARDRELQERARARAAKRGSVHESRAPLVSSRPGGRRLGRLQEAPRAEPERSACGIPFGRDLQRAESQPGRCHPADPSRPRRHARAQAGVCLDGPGLREAGAEKGSSGSARAGRPVVPDGVLRCSWCAGHDDLVAYHDSEWGFPVSDDRRLFEKLCLEGFQSGLSWLTILRKREAFRRAFADFDFERVARFGSRQVDRMLADASIVQASGKDRIDDRERAPRARAGG